MKMLLIQHDYQGEKFPMWPTDAETLAEAWAEIEIEGKPETGAWISFDGEDEYMIVNGGFDYES